MTKIQVNSQGKAYLTTAGKALAGVQPTLVTKSITENGTYNASSDNADGYSSVTVNVSGSGGYSELPSYQVSSGVASKRSGTLTGHEFDDITSVGNYGLYYAFYKSSLSGQINFPNLISIGDYGLSNFASDSTQITSVNLSALKTIGTNGFLQAFSGCTNLSGAVDLSSLESIATNSFGYAFSSTKITSVDLSSLKKIPQFSFVNAFNKCSLLTSIDFSSLEEVEQQGTHSFTYAGALGETGLTTVSFPELTTIGVGGCAYLFSRSSNLTTVYFTKLNSVGAASLQSAFANCTSLTNIYFNALTTTSFGNVNALQNMLSNTGTNVTHTIHFPSNIETTIQGLTGYPTFGGTSGYVTLAFDLPATS